jgi:hypothetical protein
MKLIIEDTEYDIQDEERLSLACHVRAARHAEGFKPEEAMKAYKALYAGVTFLAAKFGGLAAYLQQSKDNELDVSFIYEFADYIGAIVDIRFTFMKNAEEELTPLIAQP